MFFADLFAGIGGFHYAVKNVYESASVALVSEIDPFAISTYCKNHCFRENEVADIRTITGRLSRREIIFEGENKIDLVVGGFPCQTFSKAGKRAGFDDKDRGELFFEVVKIIKILKPKMVLLENVSNLAGHDQGNTWERIRKELDLAGYWVPEMPIVLSPHTLKVTRQIRKRVFIPAISKAQKVNFKPTRQYFEDVQPNSFFEEVKLDRRLSPESIVRDPMKIQVIEAWGEFVKGTKRNDNKVIPVFWLDHIKTSKKAMEPMPIWKRKMILDMQSFYKLNKTFIDGWIKRNSVGSWNKVQRKLEWQAGKDIEDVRETFLQIRPSGYRFKKRDFYPTLVAMVQTTMFYDGTKSVWRYLSVNEVRQLQSFPRSFVAHTNSFQALKQFGNAVNVRVVEKMLEKMKNCVI